MSKKDKDQEIKMNAGNQKVSPISTEHQNENHNAKKVGLGPNTKR